MCQKCSQSVPVPVKFFLHCQPFFFSSHRQFGYISKTLLLTKTGKRDGQVHSLVWCWKMLQDLSASGSDLCETSALASRHGSNPQSAYFCKQRRLMPKANRQMVLWLAIGRIKMHIHKLTDKWLEAKRHCAACGKSKLHNLEFLAKPHQLASMVHL